MIEFQQEFLWKHFQEFLGKYNQTLLDVFLHEIFEKISRGLLEDCQEEASVKFLVKNLRGFYTSSSGNRFESVSGLSCRSSSGNISKSFSDFFFQKSFEKLVQ